MERGEIFTLRVRRCRRCGGILISPKAIEAGYGHVCRQKMLEEEAARRRMERDQISLFPVGRGDGRG